MALKFVISEKGKSYQLEKEVPIIGKKIGDIIEGSLLELSGYELTITGGSDNAGFPMKNDIEGQGRRGMLTSKGLGFKGTKKIKKKTFRHEGMKKKKTLCGNTIDQNISQVNCSVSKKGEKPLEELLGKKEEEAKDVPKEESKEAPKTEEKIDTEKETPKEEKKDDTKEAPKEPKKEGD